MTMITLADLQASVRDKSAFGELAQYFTLCHAFLTLIEETQPTRIISPTDYNYVFYQYDEAYGHRITRPLNAGILLESAEDFKAAFERFMTFPQWPSTGWMVSTMLTPVPRWSLTSGYVKR